MNEHTGEAVVVKQASGVRAVPAQTRGWIIGAIACATTGGCQPARGHAASERVRQLFLPLDDPLTWP